MGDQFRKGKVRIGSKQEDDAQRQWQIVGVDVAECRSYSVVDLLNLLLLQAFGVGAQ